MKANTAALALALSTLSFILASPSLQAAPTQNGVAITQSGKPRKWKTLPVSVCTTPGLPEVARAALEKASQAWNRDIGFKVFKVGCEVDSNELNQANLTGPAVYWVKSGFGSSGDPLALARTLSSFDDTSGEMVDADILLNAEAFDWSKIDVDLESVLIHELGHTLGLQHLYPSISSVMNQYPYQSGIKRVVLDRYERLAVERLYGKSKKAFPIHFDLYFGKSTARARKELRRSGRRTADDFYMDAVLSMELKEFKEAERSLNRAVKLNSAEPLIVYRLFEVFQAQGKTLESRKVLLKLTHEWPKFYESLVELALIKIEKKEFTEATSLLERVIEINPVHYPACMLLKQITQKSTYDACISRFAPKE